MAGPETRQTLLIRIRDNEDSHSWQRFVKVYAPLIRHFCQWRGATLADAQDITQEVLGTVSRAIKTFDYDPTKGSFRSWLLKVTRNKLINHVEREKRQPVAAGNQSSIEHLANQSQPDSSEMDFWERDYRQRLFDWAVGEIQDEFREETWNAFWATAVDSQRGTKVAEQLGVNVSSVYAAKSRILRRIREKIGSVAGDWDLYLKNRE
ncbi:MAG: sigma-70 family RNA polymerase sigma factor [Verrucomicrobiae bacterium]|nr:sigma-70 family RNA polymerase sigma factor [Verrucomicrobiae bacterium]